MKLEKYKFSNYLISFILILVAFSPLISQLFKVAITFLILFFLIYLYGNKIKIKSYSIYILFFLSFVSFIISFIIDLKYLFAYDNFNAIIIGIPIYMILGFCISCYWNEIKLPINLENIIYYLSLISLFGYILMISFPFLNSYLIPYTYYNTEHKTALIFNVLQDNQSIIPRNTGIAWEPGAFQFLISIGLFLTIFNNEKKIKNFRIIILSLTILSTFSTTGLINLIFFYIYSIFSKIKNSNNNIIYIIFSILILFIILSQFSTHISTKLIGSESFDVRFEPFLNTLRNSFKYPFGIGNIGFDKINESIDIGAYDSFGMILNRYGYILLLTTIFYYIKLFTNKSLLGFFFLTMFFSQSLWYTPFVFVFLFYFININEKKKYTFIRV
jgi:hypothetical protein